MITEQELEKAIAECQGQRHPNANTCIKLAAFLTIKDQLFNKKEEEPSYSYKARPIRRYESETEFYRLARENDSEYTLAVMDELMNTLRATYPRLYSGVIQKMQ